MTTDSEPFPTRSPFQFPPVKPYVEPEPGDPEGDWRRPGNRLALGLQIEHEPGWEFARTHALDGAPFDPEKPPAGDGWVRNEYKGDHGYAVIRTAYGREMRVSYWRRKTK